MFFIGDKIFCAAQLTTPLLISFKVKDEEFDELSSSIGVLPAPYAARYKWILVTDLNKFSKKEWEYYTRQSYDLVKSKLPKKFFESIKIYLRNGNNYLQRQMPAANSGLAKVAVQCSADSFVVNQTLVLRINICGENRHLRQAANRQTVKKPSFLFNSNYRINCTLDRTSFMRELKMYFLSEVKNALAYFVHK